MKIAYVGAFAFPSSNANSLRVKGMAEALAMAGHEILICPGIPVEKGLGVTALHNGIHCHYVPEYEKGLFSKLPRGLRGLFLGDVTRHWFQSLERKPDAVVLYGTHLGYLLRMLGYCEINNIPLFLDVVEWFDPRHLPGGVLGPFAIANELSMRFVAKRATGIFVISRYLEEHFSKQGCKVLRVPPLFSFEQSRPQQFRDINHRLNLCYAGSPGKKEDMASIFSGLQMAHDAGVKFTMHIIGLTMDEFTAYFGMRSLPIFTSEGFLMFYGRVENTEARRIVASCDFMVLLRKKLRFTKAGFPSKVAESLFMGTPAMANLSSNLDEYLVDHVNSIVVRSHEATSLFDAITSASLLSENEIRKIKTDARLVGSSIFSIFDNSKNIARFIKLITD